MKNKKILILFIFTSLLILVLGYFLINYAKKIKNVEEYVPEEEISEEQFRETQVTLYFWDEEFSKLKPESRVVDIKELMNLPYTALIELLIKGPKNPSLKGIIPADTKLIGANLNNEVLILNFSKEFLNFDNSIGKQNLIDSIVKTVTELTEVNKVKILIENEENEEFFEEYVRN